MSENADRWKIDGNCSKCRRQSYCKKACRLNKKAVTDIITKAIYDRAWRIKAKQKGADDE